MKAVIMAGGFGTRLRPLTCNIPKPMVPMINKPMMAHIIDLLKTHGITDIVATLFYQPETISGYFEDGRNAGVRLQYRKAEADLGTAGSVRNARDFLDERFIIISGDILTDFDLTKAIAFHNKNKAKATILLTRVTNPLQYGVVLTRDDGRVIRFLEKPSWGEVFSDDVMASALIDRLVHHCHIVNIRGNSYRMRHHAALAPGRGFVPERPAADSGAGGGGRRSPGV